jgi:hypothetical protein
MCDPAPGDHRLEDICSSSRRRWSYYKYTYLHHFGTSALVRFPEMAIFLQTLEAWLRVEKALRLS